MPETVLRQLASELIEVPGQRLSLLGISHRTDWFATVVGEIECRIRRLLKLDEGWEVLLLQGGSSLQFSMIPMNFLAPDASADYLQTGYWSRRSHIDPRLFGNVHLAFDGEPHGFRFMPKNRDLELNPEAAYLHYVSNETVEGLQFHEVPGIDGVPRICDMSSDFLSRPLDAERFDLIYAHAQKNLGPAGLTLILLKKSFLDRQLREVPSMLDYRNHCAAQSIFNTPPTFAVYATLLVLRWLEDDIGGLDAIGQLNTLKASLIYEAIDSSNGFYRGQSIQRSRSLMNVCFHLPSTNLENIFIQEASEAGLEGLAGHRSLGGLRASVYNAVNEDSCARLATFMTDFRRRHMSLFTSADA